MHHIAGTSSNLQVRTARMRGAADRDAARRRLEATLSAVDPASLGIDEHALLLVHRVTPATRLPLASYGTTDAFSREVSVELHRQLQQARRPSRDPDAAAAAAVLFADEVDLAACLIRDWLRGAWAERWWWRTLLNGLPPPQWWRRAVLPRGDLVPAVLARLASHGDAVSWLAAWSDDDARHAIGAVTARHALAGTPSASARPDTPACLRRASTGSSRRRIADEPIDPQPQWPDTADTTIATGKRRARLLALIPELTDHRLTPAKRHLLALSLAVQRASAWARSESFAATVHALHATPVTVTGGPPHGRAERVAVAGAPDTVRPDDQRLGDPDRTSEDSPAQARPAGDRPDSSADAAVSERRPANMVAAPEKAASNGIANPDVPTNRQPATLLGVSSAPNSEHSATPPLVTEASRPIALPSGPASATAAIVRAPNMLLSPPGIEIAFGGIFYLLNVALALGLYGDFTRPLAPAIALSPWDWLALVGRAWFGRGFERDPVWALLAGLGGREPHHPPAEDFVAPQTWSMPAEWLAPWGPVTELALRATPERLQIWHPAGFVVIDVRRRHGLRPLRQARLACARHDALRRACLTRLPRLPARRAGPGHPALARWTRWMVAYLDARLARALGMEEGAAAAAQVCCHAATVRCSATHVNVQLSLAALPLELRIAGLDRDPGWIPAAGRAIAFHFG